MRLRGRKGVRESLERETDLVVLNPAQYKGRWHEFFGNRRPIHIELGMGKGRFISEMSFRNPHINYIGVDRYDELIRRATEKVRALRSGTEAEGVRNLALALLNVEHIEDAFDEREIERIYLNFSDPWPKKRHVKRRLTHPRFVAKYIRLLNEEGEIHLKTDSPLMFEYSLNSFADLGLRLHNISLDLHRNGIHPDYVMTEYEMKFVGQGMNIYRCEVIVGEKALARLRAGE
jgi:tRNA (guanine-N7-)-methyltransferase